jgi:DNA-binding LytR/AlgR family response regulator
MSRQLDVLAVDDEPHALADLADMLRRHEAVASVVEARDAATALKLLAERGFDAVFLDVRMPELDGIEFGKVIQRFATVPALVLVSAYGESAVSAFDIDAVDFVLKPASNERLDEALKRVLSLRAQSVQVGSGEMQRPTEPQHRDAGEAIAVVGRNSTLLLFIPREQVWYLESYGNYVRVVSGTGRFLHRGTLGEVEERWQEHGFMRVHRRFIVNLRRVIGLRLEGGSARVLFAKGTEVPVARRQLAEVRRRLGT